MIECKETKKVPENCRSCLYGLGFGCANANRKDDWMRYAIIGMGCPDYWLDQNRFEPVNGQRWSSFYSK